MIIRVFALLFVGTLSALGMSRIEVFADVEEARMLELFEALDLQQEGLADVRRYYEEGAIAQACQALNQYYEQRGIHDALKPQAPSFPQSSMNIAQDALRRIFTQQGVSGEVPRREDGGWDWNFGGPKNDPEWAWFLNRLKWFWALEDAFTQSRDRIYRDLLNAQLIDWVRSNPPPRIYSFSGPWRALETARRMEGTLLHIFFSQDILTPEARLMLLSSIPDHADNLIKHHAFGGNHLLTEMMALTAISMAWPEFKESRSWLDYAEKVMRQELDQQFYPDGANKELSNHYQRVTLLSFQRYWELLTLAGEEKEAAFLKKELEKAWSYFAYVMKPHNGSGPLNNDSGIENNHQRLAEVWAMFDRPDWHYIITRGAKGEKPKRLSRYFPWAGHLIMRNGYEPNSAWGFFDAGFHGSDHQHKDRLHVSIAFGGKDFLVDSGRYRYEPGAFREYFAGPAGHNIILLSGEGSQNPPDIAKEPVPVTIDTGEGAIHAQAQVRFSNGSVHSRQVEFHNEGYWLLTDTITTFTPQMMEALWHFHPDRAVEVRPDEGLIQTRDENGENVAIWIVQFTNANAELGTLPQPYQLDIIKGRNHPTPQGWYSPSFNMKIPAPCAVLKKPIQSPITIGWVIAPVQWGRPTVKGTAEKWAVIGFEAE